MKPTLEEQLQACDEKTQTLILSNIWKDFRDTDAYQALGINLKELQSIAINAIIGPRSASSERDFAGGILYAVTSISAIINMKINYILSNTGEQDIELPAESDFIPKEDPVI